MADLTDLFLAGMTAYGPPIFGLALLVGALGLPLPGTLFVLAAGAFARQGALDGTAFLWGLGGVVLGNGVGYLLGRFAETRVRRHFKTTAWQGAQVTFSQQGGIAIYLTRFLLTPLAVPTNWVAGSSRYLFGRFLLYDVDSCPDSLADSVGVGRRAVRGVTRLLPAA